MSRSIKLITGIPRSGTTLCCKLLNQSNDVVALHEPINPASMPKSFTAEQALVEIKQKIISFEHAIEQGLPFAHGDKGGLGIDNPVGNEQQNGIRKVVAERGEIQMLPRLPNSYQLIVKQNALFTALLPLLTDAFSIICIVRNPVDVLLSWMTVNLPVNRGRIPAGERFDITLKNQLDKLDCIHRQLAIYQWFMSQFLGSGLPIVRYEDIITSSGQVLDEALGIPSNESEPLVLKERAFEAQTISDLNNVVEEILAINCGGLYSKGDILARLSKITAQ